MSYSIKVNEFADFMVGAVDPQPGDYKQADYGDAARGRRIKNLTVCERCLQRPYICNTIKLPVPAKAMPLWAPQIGGSLFCLKDTSA